MLLIVRFEQGKIGSNPCQGGIMKKTKKGYSRRDFIFKAVGGAAAAGLMGKTGLKLGAQAAKSAPVPQGDGRSRPAPHPRAGQDRHPRPRRLHGRDERRQPGPGQALLRDGHPPLRHRLRLPEGAQRGDGRKRHQGAEGARPGDHRHQDPPGQARDHGPDGGQAGGRGFPCPPGPVAGPPADRLCGYPVYP